MARKKDIAALKYTLKKIDSLIAASNGDNTNCTVFTSLATRTNPFTDEQKKSVRLYLETWIREPLEATIRGIEGDRSYSNEKYLSYLYKSVVYSNPRQEGQ